MNGSLREDPPHLVHLSLTIEGGIDNDIRSWRKKAEFSFSELSHAYKMSSYQKQFAARGWRTHSVMDCQSISVGEGWFPHFCQVNRQGHFVIPITWMCIKIGFLCPRPLKSLCLEIWWMDMGLLMERVVLQKTQFQTWLNNFSRSFSFSGIN